MRNWICVVGCDNTRAKVRRLLKLVNNHSAETTRIHIKFHGTLRSSALQAEQLNIMDTPSSLDLIDKADPIIRNIQKSRVLFVV